MVRWLYSQMEKPFIKMEMAVSGNRGVWPLCLLLEMRVIKWRICVILTWESRLLDQSHLGTINNNKDLMKGHLLSAGTWRAYIGLYQSLPARMRHQKNLQTRCHKNSSIGLYEKI